MGILDKPPPDDTMPVDLGARFGLSPERENRENGAIPLRSRRCNRGRTLQQATANYKEFAGRRSQ